MSPNLANFLFESANLLLLAAGLSWLLFRPVRKALDAESQRRDADLAEAKRALEDAKAAQARADESTRQLQAEAERRERELLAASRNEADELLREARANVERERQAFVAELQATRESSVFQSAELVGQIAARSVRELLAALDGPALDLALVKRAVPEVQSLGARGRQASLIETARPLSAQSKQALSAVLDRVEERIVPELGAGVRITTPAGQVDATAASLARQAAASLRSSLTPRSGSADGA